MFIRIDDEARLVVAYIQKQTAVLHAHVTFVHVQKIYVVFIID